MNLNGELVWILGDEKNVFWLHVAMCNSYLWQMMLLALDIQTCGVHDTKCHQDLLANDAVILLFKEKSI